MTCNDGLALVSFLPMGLVALVDKPRLGLGRMPGPPGQGEERFPPKHHDCWAAPDLREVRDLRDVRDLILTNFHHLQPYADLDPVLNQRDRSIRA